MGFTETLRLLVEADTKGAVKKVEDLGKTSDREASRAKTSLDKWGNSLTKVGTGMMTFGAVAIAGLVVAGNAASDLGEVMSKNTVVFDSAAGKVEEFADGAAKLGQSKRAALEAATGFGNLFVSMGLAADKSADMSIELTKLASDLASFSNTSPEEAVEALTSALIGEAEPIRKYGVLLDEATLKAKALEMGLISTTTGTLPPAIRAQAAYAAILEQTTTAQGDFARTSDSAANQQRVAAAEFENLKASIGKGVLPAMQSLLGITNKVIGGLADMNAVTNGTAGQVATFGTVALVAGGGISTLAGQLLKSKEGFLTLIHAGSSVINALGGIKGAAIGAAGVAGIGALIFAAKELEAANQRKVLDEMAEGFQAVNFAATEASMSAIRNIESIGMLDEAFQRAEASGGDASERLIDLAEKAGVSKEVIAEYRDEIDQHSAATENAASSQDGLTGATEEGAEAMAGSAEATEEAKSALEEYSEQLQAMTDPLFAAMDAIKGNRDAQLGYRDAQSAVLEAQVELDKAIHDHGRNSSEAAEATRGLEDAQRGLTDAEWATVESAAEVDSALAGMQDAVENGDVSMRDFRSTLALWVRQGFLTQQQADIAAISVGGLASEAEAADRKRVDIPVNVSGDNAARNKLHSVRDAMSNIPSSKNVTVNVTAQGIAAINIQLAKLGGRGGGRAIGGPVRKGMLYDVVERGDPELFEDNTGKTFFIPGKDGRIIAPGHGTVSGAGFGSAGAMSGKLRVVVEDNRTAVFLNDSEVASAVRRDGILNHGRQSVRIR